jgi:1-deoxy-D-xylulose-5-phosphate reductoisomerase
LRLGGVAPALLNAANEVAVEAFLAHQLGFTQIPQLIETVLSATPQGAADDLEAVFAADVLGRAQARHWLSNHALHHKDAR